MTWLQIPRLMRGRLPPTLFPLACLAVVGLQLGLFYYFGGTALIADEPYGSLDFDTHVEQTWRVVEGLEGWGRSWVYDPHLLAGYPNGTIFDADNKGWELFTFAGKTLGLSQGQAFNLFAILAHILVVPVMFASARLFGLRRWTALVACGFAVVYWNYDSYAHWCWYVGMIAWSFASYLWLLPLGLFLRWTRERRAWQAIVIAVLMATCHLVHPYSFFVLAVPMVALFVREFRGLGIRGHLVVVAIVVVTLAVNAYWILVAAKFWHYILDSAFFAETGVSSVFWDVFGVLRDPGVTGIIGKRNGFRTVLVAASVVIMVVWRREKDPRFVPLGAAMVTMVLVTYAGSYTYLVQTQPYRHALPLGFLGCIGAAALLEYTARIRLVQRWDRATKVALGLLCIPATLFLTGEVLYFSAHSLPQPEPLPHGERAPISPLGFPTHAAYRYERWDADVLAQWVQEHDDGSGRFLIEGWSWGEQLAWKTDAQIMGGFIWRNLEHSWSNFFRQRPQGFAKDDELERYFRRYAVKWVVISTPRTQSPWWDHSKAVAHETDLGQFRIYRVIADVDLVARGTGDVEAETNIIRVTNSDPSQDLVLRYHWLQTLVCEPSCTLRRQKVRGDKVGFIRVMAPHPSDLVISNGY